ncbi:AP-1 complex subunit sigma-1 [Sporothrix brasiliensis 5110]|nr:AP-1 complex subunit sigma-1 [Sporothrix brasiliensis 5110]KIH93123.1 AP-1 complex subunit sigma-1 [Sporothrix brasiliensis 5110]
MPRKYLSPDDTSFTHASRDTATSPSRTRASPSRRFHNPDRIPESASLHFIRPTTPTFPAFSMAINYLILLSRQGKVRLAKWFTTLSPKEKAKIVKDVTQLVLARRTRMCNFLEYKNTKIVYRRYASLFFIAGCSSDDNELITLEIIHRYVEQMDKYYGNVCELDIIFSFTKAYYILDELLLAGELQESSKKNVLRCIGQQDSLEDMEVEEEVTKIM